MAEVCLAERRKKQKWSTDPRGNAWSKDKEKFGYKMLEKMGWSDGSGLGASQDGRTSHVKVGYKDNTLGLGTTTQHADNWIEHQSDFDGLLASLQQQGPSEPSSTNVSGRSSPSAGLQAKAQQSRARINYNKFLRGKDISGYSSNDMSCIFGERGATDKNTQSNLGQVPSKTSGTSSSSDSDSTDDSKSREIVASKAAGDKDDDGLRTTVSTQSVQDYFASKLARLKGAKSVVGQSAWLSATAATSAGTCVGSEDEEACRAPKSKKRSKGDSEHQADSVAPVSKKSKKRKKSSKPATDDEEEEAVVDPAPKRKRKKVADQEEADVERKADKKNKKKKKKSKH